MINKTRTAEKTCCNLMDQCSTARHPTGHPPLLTNRRGHCLKVGLEKRTWDNTSAHPPAARTPDPAAQTTGCSPIRDALAYALQRKSFGKPIWQHQSIGNHLADMATKLVAARQLVLHAARRFEAGERADMEAGMAKLFASESAMQIALDAIRIHGGYGYSTEFDVERYFRDAPLMIVGEGTNEIQRTVIARQLVARNTVAP